MAEESSPEQQPVSPTGLGYGGVFVVLAVITAIEVWLGTSEIARSVRTGLFLALSLIKAGFVAAYYMHLKRDSRLYSYIFVAPAVLLLVFVLIAAVP